MRELLWVDFKDWKIENEHFAAYLDEFGERVPEELRAEQQRLASELEQAL